jgi:phage terminase large subunit-like protein
LPTIPSARLGRQGPHFYLLNILRKKLDFPNLKRAARGHADLFSPTTILIEGKASGTQLIQDLVDAGLSRVTRYKPDGDKISANRNHRERLRPLARNRSLARLLSS